MTEKLYYQDAYLCTCRAKIEKITEFNGKSAVVLDKTVFFPEGGGQTSDIGLINETEVFDVQIDDGIIYHIVNSTEGLKNGDEVECKIDWEKRFSDMQQHSGEHIFSGIVHSLFELDNLGFHLGSEAVTMDFGRVLSESELTQVEILANKAIWNDITINCFFPSEDELKNYEYRSKKELTEAVRLVEIEGIDLCACCAPHVRRTGEIGMLKIVSVEKVRGGSRVNILCGERAFEDVCKKLAQNKEISVMLSEKEFETASAVSRVMREKEQLSIQINELKLEQVKKEVSNAEEKEIQIEFCAFQGDFLRKYADMLAEKASKFAVVFSGADNDYRFVMISKTDFDVNSVVSEMKKSVEIRGGGRNGMVQGSVKAERNVLESLLCN